jgi:hypothetical protein
MPYTWWGLRVLNNRINGLRDLDTGNSRLGSPHDPTLVRAFLLACRQQPSPYVLSDFSSVMRGKGSSLFLFS